MGTQIDGADRTEHVTHHGNAVESYQAKQQDKQQQRPHEARSSLLLSPLQIFCPLWRAKDMAIVSSSALFSVSSKEHS